MTVLAKDNKGVCITCGAGKWQPAADHRAESCADHYQCVTVDQTEFEVVAPTTSTDRACERHTECDFNEQWESKPAEALVDRHCTGLTRCSQGFFVGVPKTQTSDLICQACGDHEYQPNDLHRIDSCEEQPTCPTGHSITEDSKIVKRECIECEDNFYQHVDEHRVTDCLEQPFCKEAEFMSSDTKHAKRTCHDCEAGSCEDVVYPESAECTGTYQQETEHRLTECIVQNVTSCGVDQVMVLETRNSRIAPQSCIPCPSTEDPIHDKGGRVAPRLDNKSLIITL